MVAEAELTALGPRYETLGSRGAELTVNWQMGPSKRCQCLKSESDRRVKPVASQLIVVVLMRRLLWGSFLFLLTLVASVVPVAGRGKDKLSYGEGLIVNVPMPESEVAQVVEEIAQNGLIRGTKEYNKDEFITGAKAAASSRVFPAWTEGGKVFYKVREQAIDPRNFKDGGDVGTLAVRYVVQPQGEKNTVLRINALFVEDFRKVTHPSNGSVEGAEYKDIHEHLEAIEVMKKQTEEAKREREEQLERKQNLAMQSGTRANELPSSSLSESRVGENPAATDLQPATTQPSGAPPPAQSAPVQTLEEHVKELRKQVERLVKAPGAPLKSAPFHTASTLQTLTTGTEVLILISTPYWYGVETHEGQHGWMQRGELEQP
jgi:polyhydroxyalkanoate synthesis regulator phasin